MADVLRGPMMLWFHRVLALVAAYKAAELYTVDAPLALSLGLAIGAFLVIFFPRAGAAAIALAVLGVELTAWYRNHLALLMWLAFAVALFPHPAQLRFVVRAQLSIMYGFATLAKLWPDWLSGEALRGYAWVARHLPTGALVGLAWAVVLVEATLAVGVWTRRRAFLWLAVAMHFGFVVGLHPDVLEIGRLTVFGILAIAAWLLVREDSATT